MPHTFIVLLRGVNVGRSPRIAMADLRSALAADGLPDARTYLQSGNLVLPAPNDDADAIAAHVRSVIARRFGIDVPVIAVSPRELHRIADAMPFSGDPRLLHVIVLAGAPTREVVERASEAVARARAEGSADDARIIGRAAYLSTPDGFGRSRLAAVLLSGARAPLRDGTARNWRTVTALLAMCD